MKVLVDTSVWSLVLRRKVSLESPHSKILSDLIADGRVALLGVVRQEILSGVRSPEQFKMLKEKLRAFPDLNLEIEDYETAAEFFNVCMHKGAQGGDIDFLICASAYRRNFQILTADNDFDRYAQHVPIKLLKPNAL
jgi:predicted nucleic acid-binding protein